VSEFLMPFARNGHRDPTQKHLPKPGNLVWLDPPTADRDLERPGEPVLVHLDEHAVVLLRADPGAVGRGPRALRNAIQRGDGRREGESGAGGRHSVPGVRIFGTPYVRERLLHGKL